jgi:starch phosphorylase
MINHDTFMTLADYRSYVDCQQQVGEVWGDKSHWDQMSILNVARMGKFSSDRSIREYAERIWHVQPLPVEI